MKNYLIQLAFITFCFLGIIACEKTEIVEDITQTTVPVALQESPDEEAEISRMIENAPPSRSYREWPVSPTCANGRVTFIVRDAPADAAIKLYFALDGQITYTNLKRHSGNPRYQYVTMTIPKKGEWGYRYVDKNTRQGFPQSNGYSFNNSGVSINTNGTSQLYWPFGADGSSATSPNGWRNISGSTAHTGLETNAQDWNWGSGNDDRGKFVHSPLDGKVLFAGWKNCYGNTVEILQVSNGKRVVFRVSHLTQINTYTGAYVTKGRTIGTVGNTGSSTCSWSFAAHAHCALFEVNSSNTKIKGLNFNFNASCN